MSEPLLPAADDASVGQLPAMVVASVATMGLPSATVVSTTEAVVLSPTMELPSVTDELRRFGIDHARLVANSGRAALIWFTLFVLYGSQHPPSRGALLGLTVAAGVWLVALRSAALARLTVPVRMVWSGLGTAVGFGIVLALDQTVVGLDVSVATAVLYALGVLCSVLVWDWFVELTLDARKRVLLVGSDDAGALLTDELRTSPHARFDLVGAVSASEELTEIVIAQRPDIVVLTDEQTYGAAIERLLDARANVRVTGLASFFEYAFGRVPIDRISTAWFMSLLHPRQHIYTRFTKRIFDVVVALIGLVLTAPLVSVLALATKLTGGPILYRQTRVGEHGRPFTIYKLRTMGWDAEHDGATFARGNDPRATPTGRFLRQTHLDELPQLWNVLRGEMSIVGPRPERPEFIEMIEDSVPFWSRRLLVKPGITGWAQVRSGYASDCDAMETKLSYDLWYLRHRSLLVDLAVCVMTFFAIFARPRRPDRRITSA